MDLRKKVIIAIDTEFESNNILMGNCLQLAFVVFLDDTKLTDIKDDSWILDKLSICFKDQEGKIKDPANVEWWLTKHPDIYNKIKSEGENVKENIIKLQNWLNNIHEKYQIISFLADHSSVDMQWFCGLFLTHHNKSETKFILPWGCICTNNMRKTLKLIGVKNKEFSKFCYSKQYKHTHYALDDAVATAYEYLGLKYIADNHKEALDFNRKIYLGFIVLGFLTASTIFKN